MSTGVGSMNEEDTSDSEYEYINVIIEWINTISSRIQPLAQVTIRVLLQCQQYLLLLEGIRNMHLVQIVIVLEEQ